MKRAVWVVLVLVLVPLVILAIARGAVPLSPGDVIGALAGRGDAETIAIVRTLRLPRVALALLVGAGLGMAGAALQGSLRNALAEPYLLGVSGGAAVGAVCGVALGLSGDAAIPLAAFAGPRLRLRLTSRHARTPLL